MKITIDVPDITAYIAQAIDEALKNKQTELIGWKYYSLDETSKLLQIKHSTLLDKRMPFLNELEYSQSGKIYWFTKKSVEDFISNRTIMKYRKR